VGWTNYVCCSIALAQSVGSLVAWKTVGDRKWLRVVGLAN